MSVQESSVAGDAGAQLRRSALDATFTGFFIRHYGDVQRFLRRLEADHGMVEDALQEAFLVTRVKWEDVQDYTNPRAWVMAVARKKLCDHQKLRGRAPTIYFEDIGMPEIPAPASPDEAEDLLAGWIQLLPPRMGAVVALVLEGLTDDLIAKALDISRNTVREHRTKALPKLKHLAEIDGFTVPAGRRRR